MAADSSPLRSSIQSHAVSSLTPAPMLLAQAQSLGESRLPGESCREGRLQQDGGLCTPAWKDRATWGQAEEHLEVQGPSLGPAAEPLTLKSG